MSNFKITFVSLSYLAVGTLAWTSAPASPDIRHIAETVLTGVVGWLFVWSLCGKPAIFHWLLLPAFLLAPVEIYLKQQYGEGLMAHHIGVILETSVPEALEFFGPELPIAVVLEVVAAVWWYVVFKYAKTEKRLNWTGKTRILALTTTSAVLVFAVFQDSYRRNDDASTPHKRHETPLFHVPVTKQTAADVWPFSLLVTATNFMAERAYLKELTEQNHDYHFHARRVDSTEAQTFVVVIGESSRYDRWGLHNYSRNTTPFLAKEPNVVTLNDMVTPVTATRLSVPIILTRKPATRGLTPGFLEKSFISAFKEAGFKTFWISNQMSYGKFDTPVSALAKEADIVQFINLQGTRAPFDEMLITPMQKALNDSARQKLIILHTAGSHWNYSQRYPREFERWTPSLQGINDTSITERAQKERLNNSYDNSILYTDYFLEQVIKALVSTNSVTAAMYVADHGEALYDGKCEIAFHGHSTQFEFHVPSIIWYSDAYQRQYPQKIANLLRHRNAKVSTENVFHSIVDMANIQYATEQKEKSLFNEQLRPEPRYVNSHGWLNYDTATRRGDCLELTAPE